VIPEGRALAGIDGEIGELEGQRTTMTWTQVNPAGARQSDRYVYSRLLGCYPSAKSLADMFTIWTCL
jgi:hypothetical protein